MGEYIYFIYKSNMKPIMTPYNNWESGKPSRHKPNCVETLACSETGQKSNKNDKTDADRLYDSQFFLVFSGIFVYAVGVCCGAVS